MLAALALGAPLASCGPEPSQGREFTIFFNELEIVLAPGDTELGLDLDAENSMEANPSPCPHSDFTDYAGRVGIDNQLARSGLGPVFERLQGDIGAAFQENINSGSLALVVEVTEVDSYENDPHVLVRMARGEGPNNLGTDGLGEPYQSFDVYPGTVLLEGRGQIVDGELTVELDGELSVPFRLIQVPGEVRLSRLSARFRMDAEVGVSSEGVIGAVGAVVEVDDLITLVDNLDAANGLDPSLVALAGQVLRRNADFDPEVDAESSFSCTKMSMGLSARAVPAFLLPGD